VVSLKRELNEAYATIDALKEQLRKIKEGAVAKEFVPVSNSNTEMQEHMDLLVFSCSFFFQRFYIVSKIGRDTGRREVEKHSVGRSVGRGKVYECRFEKTSLGTEAHAQQCHG
jgi:hypothetical protein